MNIASLIFRPDLGFFVLTSLQSFRRPSLSSGSSSRISLRRQSFSVSRPRLRPPGNIHSRSRLLLTSKTRPCLTATSFDDLAIRVAHRPKSNHFVRLYRMLDAIVDTACQGFSIAGDTTAVCHPMAVQGGLGEFPVGLLRITAGWLRTNGACASAQVEGAASRQLDSGQGSFWT